MATSHRMIHNIVFQDHEIASFCSRKESPGQLPEAIDLSCCEGVTRENPWPIITVGWPSANPTWRCFFCFPSQKTSMLNGWQVHLTPNGSWSCSPMIFVTGIALPSWAPNSRHGFGHEILCLRSFWTSKLGAKKTSKTPMFLWFTRPIYQFLSSFVVVLYGTNPHLAATISHPQLLPLAPWHPALQAWQVTLATMIMDMNDDQKDDYVMYIVQTARLWKNTKIT